MSSNRLNPNASKIQFIWFGTPQQLQKLDFAFLSEQFPLISFSSSARRVTLDSSLTFAEHISNTTRSSYFHLRVIRRSVSSSISATLIHAFICSRIDYCNSLLIGLPKVRLSPIHLVLNTAARLVARFPRYSHISTYMFDELQWLPLRARIQFKILTLIFKAQRSLAPKYVVDVVFRPHSASYNRTLSSLDSIDFLVPLSRTALAQSRSFCLNCLFGMHFLLLYALLF